MFEHGGDGGGGVSVWVAVQLVSVITGDIKSKIDRIWDSFWSGGISNPLEVMEQITYLLFVRFLDDEQLRQEEQVSAMRRVNPDYALKDPVFRPSEEHLRWHNFKNESPMTMYETVANGVFPFIKGLGARLGGESSSYTQHMREARFTIPTPALLAKVVDPLSAIPMDDRDTNGDIYEYMLSKIAASGTNGQFRTPRHIIHLMVDMVAPAAADTICDPACGTAGFLVAANEYVRKHSAQDLTDAAVLRHYHHDMFHGFDFDSTMLRIASMNLLMHGVKNPLVEYRDSLSEGAAGESEKYSLILANPPFTGSLDYEQTARDLQSTVKTKKTELLFLALFLRLLKPGGRAAVIVPDGVLFGSSTAHKKLRKMLVEDQKLDAVVSLPSGVFKPYAGVSTAILFFTKTNSGGTDDVWFYDVQADGFSLDDKRAPVKANDLPDVLKRWIALRGDDEQAAKAERERARTEQSFCVHKSEIAEQGYDLSLNRYKEIQYEEVEYRSPAEIIAELEELDEQIRVSMAELKELLSQ